MTQPQTPAALERARAKADAFAAQVAATLNLIDTSAEAPAPTPDDSLRSFDAFKAVSAEGRE
jgi:hypothetical protein